MCAREHKQCSQGQRGQMRVCPLDSTHLELERELGVGIPHSQGFWECGLAPGDSDPLLLMSPFYFSLALEASEWYMGQSLRNGNISAPHLWRKHWLRQTAFFQFSLLHLSWSLQLRKQQLSRLFWLFGFFLMTFFFIVCASFFCTLKELPLDLNS